MMVKGMVSIIVPIYNMEPYIRECIESIEEQTYRSVEIILVDDGSTDASGQICDEYAKRDSRIKVIHKSNGGLVSARKSGLKGAHSEYVMCVDGDDWLDPDAVSRVLEIGKGADVICFAALEEYDDGENRIRKNTIDEGLYNGSEKMSDLYQNMMMNGNFFEMGILPYQWGKLVKREILIPCQTNVPDSISYAEDVACVFPYLLRAKSVFVSNMPLYHYRMRSNSMVNNEIEIDKLQSVFDVLKSAFENVDAKAKYCGNATIKENILQQLEYYKWHSMMLKGYRHIKSEMCLFPFSYVKEGMHIAIYGAGLFGQAIYQYCEASTGMSVVGWFDEKNEIYKARGMNVQSDVTIPGTEFDVLVIAILNERLAKKIKESLVNQGIADDKIDYIHAESLNRVLLLR